MGVPELLLTYLPYWLAVGAGGALWWWHLMEKGGYQLSDLWVQALVYFVTGPVAVWTAFMVWWTDREEV